MNPLAKIIFKTILGLFFFSIPFVFFLVIAVYLDKSFLHLNDDGYIIGIPFLLSLFLGIYVNNRYLKDIKERFPKGVIIFLQILVAYISVGVLAYTAFTSLLVLLTLKGLR